MVPSLAALTVGGGRGELGGFRVAREGWERGRRLERRGKGAWCTSFRCLSRK